MSDPKTVVQQFQRDIDTGRSSIVDNYIGSHYADHNPPPFASKTPGAAGQKETFEIGLGMFSDFKHVVEDQVADGDKVATRITGSGRHVGSFMGIPPCHKVVTMSGIAIHRVAHGRLIEHWGQVDAVGLLTQMGAMPPAPAPPKLSAPVIQRSGHDRVLGPAEMKARLRQLFDEGINQRKRSLLNELIDPRYVNYSMPMTTPGPAGLGQVLDMFLSGFPDMHIVVEDVLAEPDKAASRGHFTATHSGSFMNVPATGKSVKVGHIDIWAAHNGRFVENWVQMDILGLMVQLGVVPPPV